MLSHSNNVFRVILLIIASFIGARLIYVSITFFHGIELFFLLVYFGIFSILSIVFPIKTESKWEYDFSKAFIFWCMGLLVFFISFMLYHAANNYSKPVLIADFYWDYGVNLTLRENGTYKVINEDWVVGERSYGKYTNLGEGKILCKGLRFGSTSIKDTLIISEDGTKLRFNLHGKSKGLTGADMSIELNNLSQ